MEAGTVQRHISIFGKDAALRTARKAVAGALVYAMLPCALGVAGAQEAPPPPEYGASAYQPLPPEQLDSLVAPIALYPDTLVAQILAAATYPAQVVSAEQFVQANGGYPPDQLAELANTQPWDPSVKSLVAFPQVLNDLNRNMDWTTQLGNAYYNQPQDVLGAVQGMRQRAYAAGSLRPTPQETVVYQPGAIVIAPVSPAVVYVPYYDPWAVYGAPIQPYGYYHYYGPPRGVIFGAGLAIGFGVGLAVAAFTHYSWGYHSWQPDWHDRAVVYNHNTYISNSVTVINHGDYGHYDRAPQARAFNQAQAVRFGGVRNNTINNVTVNRGGNTFNNGGNTYNRGGQPFNNGGNPDNRGGQFPNRAGQFSAPTPGVNRAPGGSNGGQFGRGEAVAPVHSQGQFNNGQVQPVRPQSGFGGPAQQARPQGNGQTQPLGPQGGYGQAQQARPQGGYGGGQTPPARTQGSFNNGQVQGERPQGGYGQAQPPRPQGSFGGGYNPGAYSQGGYNQGGYNRGGGQPPQREAAPQQQRPAPQQQAQPQQHAAPPPEQRGGGGGGHDNHGGDHGGGGHDDHHR